MATSSAPDPQETGKEQRSEDFPGLKHMDEVQRYAVHSAYHFPEGRFTVEIHSEDDKAPKSWGHLTFQIPLVGLLCYFVKWANANGYAIQVFASWQLEGDPPREDRAMIAEKPAVGYSKAVQAMIDIARWD
jgi:hypothetical protein